MIATDFHHRSEKLVKNTLTELMWRRSLFVAGERERERL
jgi:hypothetical protein